MSKSLRRLIEEAIKLEFNMAEIYLSFHHRFPEDASFWWQVALEEKHHASLLRSGEQYFLDDGLFPGEIVGTALDTLVKLNSELKCILGQEKASPPLGRAFAFNLALKLEESAGEIHFQNVMQETEQPSEAIKLFQSLNDADKNHAERIRSYMRQKGLGVDCR